MLARLPQSPVPAHPRRLLLALVAGFVALIFLPLAAPWSLSVEFQSRQPTGHAVAETSSVQIIRTPASDPARRAGSAGQPFVRSGSASENGFVVEAGSSSESGAASDLVPRLLEIGFSGVWSVPRFEVVAQESAEVPVAPVLAPVEEASSLVLLIDAEDWDLVTLSNVEQALALLPSAVKTQLGNSELGILNITVSTEGVASTGSQPYGGPANYFTTNDDVNEVVLYPRQPVLTILHELGHAYNLRHSPAGDYASVLLGSEMQSFMVMAGWQVLTPSEEVISMIDHARVSFAYEGEPLWSSLSREDPLEDFANSFALYFGDPSRLAELSPERYQWFAAHF